METRALASSSASSATSACVQLLGESRDILFVGLLEDELFAALDLGGCSIVAVLLDETSLDEARVFCTEVHARPPDARRLLPDAVLDRTFDAVVFNGALERIREPGELLRAAKALVREGGAIVAVVPNPEYGAFRLAALNGLESDVAEGSLRLEAWDELFEESGYRVETAEPIVGPVFGAHRNGLALARSDFPTALVESIDRDRHAQVAAFVILAVPANGKLADRRAAREIAQWVSPLDAPQAQPAQPAPQPVPAVDAELAAERAARQELIELLRQSEASSEAIERRVAALAARRAELQAALHERSSQLELARNEAAASKERAVAAEGGLETQQRARLRAEAALRIAGAALEKARAETARFEASWFGLYAELEKERRAASALEERIAERTQALEAARADAAEARDTLASAELSLRETRVRTGALDRRIVELKASIEAGSQYASSLVRDIGNKDGLIARYGSELETLGHALDEKAQALAESIAYAQRLERELLERASAIEEASAYARSLEDRLAAVSEELAVVERAALAERAVMRAYADDLRDERERQRAEAEQAGQRHAAEMAELGELHRTKTGALLGELAAVRAQETELRERVLDAEALLVKQTEELVASMHAESAQLSLLIDTVQSSRFWKLKRWMARLRSHFFGL